MSKGYICAASPEYVNNAYWLACSLKKTNPGYGLAVLVEHIDDIPVELRSEFIEIIPCGTDVRKRLGKYGLSTLFYELTPFDETIALDADMLFLDKDPNWKALSFQDATWATAVDSEGKPVTKACRQAFQDLDLPDFYIAYFYFGKNKPSERLFRLASTIFNDWPLWRAKLAPPYCFNLELSTDVAFALASKLTLSHPSWHPTFTHYRPELNNSKPEVIEEGLLYIGMRAQRLPFHYHKKNWAEDKPGLWR